MAYDEKLADRIRQALRPRDDVVEKKMFGGLCFMVSDHMCCGIVGDSLMLRVGPDHYTGLLAHRHAREMDFTGKAMKGMLYIEPEGMAGDRALGEWLGHALDFVISLPPKKTRKIPQAVPCH